MLMRVHHIVWGIPTLILILGVGLYLSVRTGFAQIRFIPQALQQFFQKIGKPRNYGNSISPNQALCTALAATVGTGNLAGVAGAIALGGPGSVFWMWICAFFGMVTKLAEATLSVRFRVRNERDEFFAGPMYYITEGLGKRWHWLAATYACFGVIASFGVGNATQVNAVINGVNCVIQYLGGTQSREVNLLLGAFLSVLVAGMLFGGTNRIGKVAENIVPFAAVFYLLLCLFVLVIRFSAIYDAFSLILHGAFSPRAVTGGILGSSFQALRVGASRGVFTNEAGMGTAGIAHGTASVAHPIEQGLMGIVEVFLDTIVICTMTALVILCSGVYIPYGQDLGGKLTLDAFSSVCSQWVCIPISVALCLFAIATILGWGLYGRSCAQFLFGDKAWKPLLFAQLFVIVIAAVLKTDTVWLLAEIVNGLMAIPNLIALVLLCPEMIRLTNEYRKLSGRAPADGGTDENFNQCKPLRTFSYEKVPSSGSESCKER